jgi:hypothetical protein
MPDNSQQSASATSVHTCKTETIEAQKKVMKEEYHIRLNTKDDTIREAASAAWNAVCIDYLRNTKVGSTRVWPKCEACEASQSGRGA